MRIAILGPAAPRGFIDLLSSAQQPVPEGMVGTPVNGLARALIELGHEVTLITASPGIDQVWRADGPWLHLRVVPYRPRARSRALDFFHQERAGLRAELRRAEVDVVSAHWSYEYGWVGVTSGLPNLLTVHDAPLTILRHLPDPYRLIRTLMAYRVRLSATRISAVSPYLAAKWRRQMFYRKDIAVIPNIVPFLRKVEQTERIGPVILDIADGSPRKNVRSLLEAFALVLQRQPGAELRLIGSGLGPADPLALWARSESLDRRVIFLGFQTRDQISEHLAQSSVFCHPSHEESQPMALLEAMAAGVPVIGGAKAGGVPWTLDRGNAGLLVDVAQPLELARGIVHLCADRRAREGFIRRGKTLVRSRFSAAAVTAQYVEQYEILIRNARIGRGRKCGGQLENK